VVHELDAWRYLQCLSEKAERFERHFLYHLVDCSVNFNLLPLHLRLGGLRCHDGNDVAGMEPRTGKKQEGAPRDARCSDVAGERGFGAGVREFTHSRDTLEKGQRGAGAGEREKCSHRAIRARSGKRVALVWLQHIQSQWASRRGRKACSSSIVHASLSPYRNPRRQQYQVPPFQHVHKQCQQTSRFAVALRPGCIYF
jgi:hypothetical protein